MAALQMEKTSMMTCRVLALMAMLLVTGVVFGQRVDKKGKAWLAQHKEPSQINVTGNWSTADWGTIVLKQAEGSREVTGSGDGWRIDGVVSGMKIYLLFSHKGKVNYCAELEAESEVLLTGQYSNGMMRPKAKLRPMALLK